MSQHPPHGFGKPKKIQQFKQRRRDAIVVTIKKIKTLEHEIELLKQEISEKAPKPQEEKRKELQKLRKEKKLREKKILLTKIKKLNEKLIIIDRMLKSGRIKESIKLYTEERDKLIQKVPTATE